MGAAARGKISVHLLEKVSIIFRISDAFYMFVLKKRWIISLSEMRSLRKCSLYFRNPITFSQIPNGYY